MDCDYRRPECTNAGTEIDGKWYCLNHLPEPRPKPELWEILVPTVRNDGRPIRLRFHRVWDAKVRAISGGLTIMPVAKGQWVYDGALFKERMIPVRIVATRKQIESIIDMTAVYYDQIAVMAYKVSEEVIIKYRN
jgi:hypothetical protein